MPTSKATGIRPWKSCCLIFATFILFICNSFMSSDFTHKTVLMSKFKENVTDEPLFHDIRTSLLVNSLTVDSFLQPLTLEAWKKQTENHTIFNQCAVVGSSGILKDSGCGREISSHDFIIRQNMASYEGYETDVGNRTDLMSLNYVIAFKMWLCLSNPTKSCYKLYYDQLSNLKKSIILMSVFNDAMDKVRFEMHLKFLDSLGKNGLDLDVRISAKGVLPGIKRFWNFSKKPTAGLRCLTMALTMCRSVSVYGFYPFKVGPSGKPIPCHYFDDTPFAFGSHDMKQEQSLLKALNRSKTIKLITDKCSKQTFERTKINHERMGLSN